MKLSREEIQEKLSALQGWEYTDNSIVKTFILADFKAAMDMVNQVAMVSESKQHHPDIDIRYNRVTFKLSTHSEGGVTEKDFGLAKEIDTHRN